MESASNSGNNYQSGYGGGYNYQQNQSGDYERFQKVENHEKRMEHLGEVGAVAAGAFALYEKHEVKADPEHARRHKLEEEATAVGVVAGGGVCAVRAP